jgi:hypothetical protein
MELTVSLETVCRLIVRARELEALTEADAEAPDEEEEALDPDEALSPLDPDVDDTVEEEIEAFLDDLADDELVEVLALAMVGRGTFDATEWDEAIEAAGEEEDPIAELMEMPMLAGYLDAGLAAFDLSCTGIGQLD